MEIQEVKVKLQVMKRLVDDVEEAVKQKTVEMNDELEELKSKLEGLKKDNIALTVQDILSKDEIEEMKKSMMVANIVSNSELKKLEKKNSTLMTKYIQSNDEIQAARKELIAGFAGLLGDRTAIGIKRMGELDDKSFLNACKKRFPAYEDTIEASILCSTWQEKLKDLEWHPFKRIGDNCDNEKEVIDEEDERLKKLSIEWGEEVHNAVKIALEEMNEYNPSGRSPIPELWNFKEGRRATIKEVVTYILNHIKSLKRKRT